VLLKAPALRHDLVWTDDTPIAALAPGRILAELDAPAAYALWRIARRVA